MINNKETIAIIGAGPGTGYAVAERFGKEGFNVALIARNADKLKTLTINLEKEGITAKYFTADVLDFKALEKALQDTKSHFGSVDVIEFSPTPPEDSMKQPRDITVTNEQFHLDLQVLAPIAAVQAVLPDMMAKKKGSLLFTTAASANIRQP